jgi:arylsulfatase
MHWPDRIKDINTMRRSPAQLTDIMPTVLEAAGAQYPSEYNGHKILPLEGESLVPLFDGDERSRGMLFWEHEGNEAVRDGKWKLVKKYPGKYELYDMQDDRTELHDLSDTYPEKVEKMKKAYSQWAARCKVILRDKILSIEN